MLNFIRTLPVMACGLLLHTNLQAAEILIDDFSTDQGPVVDLIVDSDGSSNQVSTGGADILGGWRDIYVEELSNDITRRDGTAQPDDPTLGIKAQVSGGRFSGVLDDLVKGYAVVTYDGSNEVGSNWDTGVDTSGLGGLDWSGTTGFLFEDVSNDLVAPAQLIVWTNDFGTGYVKHVLDFNTFGSINNGGLYDAFISANGFTGAGSINWADVGAFQAIFNLDSTGGGGVISVDLSLSRATTVMMPEPTALSVFGAGVLMMGFVGYRRRKHQ